MKNISQKILFDQLTDFASQFGDQALLDLLNEWQLVKLGENPQKKGGAGEVISEKENNLPPNFPWSYRQGFGDAMDGVRQTALKLQENLQEKDYQYQAGVLDACIEILEVIKKKGSEIL